MDSKNGLFCAMFTLLLTLMGTGIPQQQSDVKRKQVSVKGRVIGYSMREHLRSVQGRVVSAPHDAFLLQVEQGNEELGSGTYIKIQYRVTSQNYKDLPVELFEQSTQRSFVLQKDETCNESVESFIYGDRFGGKESSVETGKRFPNLVRLRGAENVRLPEEGILPCYTFEREDIGRQLEQ